MNNKMDFNEEMATEYDKGVRRTLPSYDAMIRLAHTYIRMKTNNDARVLIVGAGGGNELVTFGTSNPEWTFTAVDPASPMLAIAKTKTDHYELTDRVKFIEGTIENVDDLHTFDAATCLLVLHFIPDVEEKLRQLKSIRQRLKTGAPFVLTTMYGNPDEPKFDGLFSLWRAYWLDSTNLTELEVDEMEKTVRGLSFIPENEIERLLFEAGFGNIAKFFTTNMFGGWICKAD